MRESTYSKISNAVSPLIRRYTDIAIRKAGAFVQVLKISVPEGARPDIHGRMPNPTVSTDIISNAVINYPVNELEMFDRVKDNDLNINSIDIMELLPINFYTSFETDITSGEIVDLERGDYIIHVLRDHKKNKLPIKLQVETLKGAFNDRNLVNMWYELSLVRGKLRSDVENIIQEYVEELE